LHLPPFENENGQSDHGRHAQEDNPIYTLLNHVILDLACTQGTNPISGLDWSHLRPFRGLQLQEFRLWEKGAGSTPWVVCRRHSLVPSKQK